MRSEEGEGGVTVSNRGYSPNCGVFRHLNIVGVCLKGGGGRGGEGGSWTSQDPPNYALEKPERICSYYPPPPLPLPSPTIRDVARVLRLMTSTLHGVIYGPQHHKFLEMGKTQAFLDLSQEALEDLKWWITAVPKSYNLLAMVIPRLS